MNTNLSITIRELILLGALAVWLFGAVPGAQSYDPPPVVTITATDATASEVGPDPGTFTVWRLGSSVALTVYYTISGTATNGVDYQTLPGSVTIAGNQPSATVTVTPIPDCVLESNETVVLTLANNANYSIGTPSSATVTIADAPADSDCDGLPDVWELQYFGNLTQTASGDPDGDGLTNLQEYQLGTDPADYFNGALPVLSLVGGDSLMTRLGSDFALPLTVRVISTNGVVLTNAPLAFGVTNGPAQFGVSTNGPWTTNLLLRTDGQGEATAWLLLTNALGTNDVTVTAVSGTNEVQMQFAVWVNDPASLYYAVQCVADEPSLPVSLGVKLYWLNYDEMQQRVIPGGGGGGTNNPPDILPWLHQDERLDDGTPVDEGVAAERQRTRQDALTRELQQDTDAQQEAIDEFLQRTGQPRFVIDEEGGTAAIVGFVDGMLDANITFNRVAADTIGADEVAPGGSLNLGLTGTNTVIGLWDGGDIRISHREFSTNGVRVIDMDGASIFGVSDHGTHVSGTLNAYGVDTNATGMSRRATVWANDFNNDYLKMSQQASSNVFRVSNHSYGKRRGWSGTVNIGGTNYPAWWGVTNISQTEDCYFGFYDVNARTIDVLTYISPTYLQVWAAGNERGSAGAAPTNQPVLHAIFNTNIADWVVVTSVTRPNDGDPGGFDLLTQPQCAKNNLVVGAVSGIVGGWNGSNSVVMSSFSSFGPTDDGRIKPDIVADGVNLWSSGSFFDSDYYYNSGTSMASPSTAGALNLLVELQNRFYGTNRPMLASTQRGLAIHSADEAGSFAGPDYRFGWGLLNIRRAAELMTNNFASGALPHIKEVRLVSGDHIEFGVKATNTQPLKVSVVWTDPPGTPAPLSLDPTNRMLVNDIDARVFAPNGTTNFPYVLDPVTRTNAATTGDNIRDNAEQVFIASPTNGTYTVRVTHKGNLLNDSGQVADQWVSILISGNIPQPQLPLAFTAITRGPTNSLAFKWNAEVGRVYQLQYRDDVASGTWQTGSGEISATKTNVALSIPMPSATNRFYRLVQLR